MAILLRPVALGLLLAVSAMASPEAVKTVYRNSGTIPAHFHTQLSSAKNAGVYSLLFSVTTPRAFGSDGRALIQIKVSGRVVAEKTLHTGDPDWYTTFRLPAGSHAELSVENRGVSGTYSAQVNRWPDDVRTPGGANHTWQTAAVMELGKTVFASGDDAPYIPLPGTLRKQIVADPKGEDWYKFHFDAARPKLVFFQLELMDRDDLPVDVTVFREQNGKLQEETAGIDPVSPPHEVQALPGNKFSPRVLSDSGDYYVRVRANHPEYKLRTRLNEVPPYANPQEAVQTAVDYIMGAGDSWFANTPRRGGTFDRVSPVHQETSLCVACHPSHFSQRAQLYAAHNGYAVHQRQQLQFLEERFYNNPRPFYGFEADGVVWSRVISAAASVLSRMSVITDLFEREVSGVDQGPYHDKIRNYLKLYYDGRTSLPADETNGNTPLVSNQEVGWYSWKTMRDAKLPEMIAAAPLKNVIDLCYQTLALADIDGTKYRTQIDANAKRILSLQRADGQWSAKFEVSEPSVEFETGHALWALAAAGVPKEDPQVAKAIRFLLGRQQPFGGWMDPLQSFENFRTPFRETQFASIALSAYFPKSARPKGWGAEPVSVLPTNPANLLEQLDNLWDQPSAAVLKQVEAAAQSNDALLRQAAVEALGRIAPAAEQALFVKLLGDPSKLVQRTAAWALRQSDSGSVLPAAMAASDDRLRWGAARVFAHHFSKLAQDDRIVNAMLPLLNDPVPSIQMTAARALWQSWFWNGHPVMRGQIEDAVLAQFSKPQHPWVETNLRAAVYNIADENIRYLYNNWVPLMAREADQRKAIAGRLAVEQQFGDKVAAILSTGTVRTKKRVLSGLDDLPLRRADIYDPESELPAPQPLAYNRLGNDIEQIAWFGDTADKIAAALLPLLESADPELRALARKGALLARETPFTKVHQQAGGPGEHTRELEARIAQMPDTKEISKAFHLPQPKSPADAGISKPAPTSALAKLAEVKIENRLDERTFRSEIEPIFQAKGEDGYACVNCHATHTLFNATWQTVANVVDLKNPENSLVLKKPISTAETEGVAASASTAHGGGKRWSKGSAEYQAILRWIQAARDPGVTQAVAR